MGSLLMHLKLTNLTVEELHDQLGKLMFAGWGTSAPTFSVGGKESCSVELSLFRALPEPVKKASCSP